MKKRVNSSVKLVVGVFAVVGFVATAPLITSAQEADSQLTQEITAGTLSTDFRSNTGTLLTNPTFGMNSVIASNSQLTATGTFGDDARRISVDNPGGANGGWTLALNAECPEVGPGCATVSQWTHGTTPANNYAYNAASAAAGQLTVTPSAGTLTSRVGSSTGITRPGAQTFDDAGAITLLSAASGSDDIWNGYLINVGLSQVIPASTATGTYTLNMVQTVTSS